MTNRDLLSLVEYLSGAFWLVVNYSAVACGWSFLDITELDPAVGSQLLSSVLWLVHIETYIYCNSSSGWWWVQVPDDSSVKFLNFRQNRHGIWKFAWHFRKNKSKSKISGFYSLKQCSENSFQLLSQKYIDNSVSIADLNAVCLGSNII